MKSTENESVEEMEPILRQRRSITVFWLFCCLHVAWLTSTVSKRSDGVNIRQSYVTHNQNTNKALLNLKPKSRVHYFDESSRVLRHEIKERVDSQRRLFLLQKAPVHHDMETCEPQYDWQKSNHPNCNFAHELDLLDVSSKVLSRGSYRHAWKVPNTAASSKSPYFVLKTLIFRREYVDVNFEKHRVDALISERLTSSRHVIDIYGFCGTTAAYEFATGSDLSHVIFPADPAEKQTSKPSPIRKLKIVIEVASAIADVHNVDHVGRASIAHGDISMDQFLNVDGAFKLGDFNMGQLLFWNVKDNTSCKFYEIQLFGNSLSPEEYKYSPLDEKIDVYRMGNIIHDILTEEHVWSRLHLNVVQEKVTQGYRPEIPDRFTHSDEPAEKTLLEAMKMCYVHEPRLRPSAREVLTFLMERYNTIESGVESA